MVSLTTFLTGVLFAAGSVYFRKLISPFIQPESKKKRFFNSHKDRALLYHHQPPSSVLGDITPYQCLFGSPPDYENIILFLLCLYTCPATSEACTSCKQMFFKGGMPRLRKAFDVLILLLVFDGPASYLP